MVLLLTRLRRAARATAFFAAASSFSYDMTKLQDNICIKKLILCSFSEPIHRRLLHIYRVYTCFKTHFRGKWCRPFFTFQVDVYERKLKESNMLECRLRKKGHVLKGTFAISHHISILLIFNKTRVIINRYTKQIR